MEFDAAKPDVPIGQEKWDGYWRERAECLEEWVCELLRKNQILRMALQKEQPQQQYLEETTPALSSPGIYQSLSPSDRQQGAKEDSLAEGFETLPMR